MEINLNNVQSANPATNNNAAGVAAPNTNEQRADISATRVVSPKETANLEDKASSADERRFDAVKTRSLQYSKGENYILNDIKFTVYSKQSPDEYLVRFTDIKTGAIEIKNEAELFRGTGGGDLVSGQV